MGTPFYLRQACIKDMKSVFHLSNEEAVRQYAIHKEPIPWETHVEWFQRTLEDHKKVFIIVEDHEGHFGGQVRFSLDKKKATVSISLGPNLRGKGLSKQILKESIAFMTEDHRDIGEVVALVYEENRASLKLFKGVGFKVTEKTGSLYCLIYEVLT